MLINNWLAAFAFSVAGKRNVLSSLTCSGFGDRRQQSPLAQAVPVALQVEPLELRVLLAATNPFDLGTLDGTDRFSTGRH